MDLKELEFLAKQGESEILECKKSTALLDGAAQTLCGFLNGKGGSVLIGVTSDGKLVGQDVTDNTLQEIARVLAKFEPPAQIDIEQVKIQKNRDVIILSCFFRKQEVPYIWDGRPYQRVGSTTSRMAQTVYQRLLLQRDQNNHRWETGLAPYYPIQNLDENEILRTIRLGSEARRIPEYQGDSIASILDKLGIRREGVLLNAAIVLFGTKFLPDFPQCQLRLARFKGIDKSEFIDQNQLTGNAFYLLEEALLFLRRHLPIGAAINASGLERIDKPSVPFEALREALVNAICHRSYSNSGGGISVAIFDDRLEIWNDGKLPFGFTVEDLKKAHTSHPPNPLIANVFYSRGLIEKWGRGTQKIVELCIHAGHREPEFVEQANSFMIRFWSSKQAVLTARKPENLTEREYHILHVLLESSSVGMTFTAIKSMLVNPPADRTLRDDFQRLKKLGLIINSGHGRGATWSLVKNPENKAE